MVNHEFEYPDDYIGSETDPYCDRFGCNRPLSAHPEEVSGAYDDDEMPSWGEDNDIARIFGRYV